MNSKDKGDISEAHALTKLKELGYGVYTPFGENTRSDIIAEDTDGELYRIQVKTGRLKQDGRVIIFDTASNFQNSEGFVREEYTEEEIDAFIVYSHDIDRLYWVDIDETGSGAMSLRLEAKQNQKSINWAEEYEL